MTYIEALRSHIRKLETALRVIAATEHCVCNTLTKIALNAIEIVEPAEDEGD